MPAALFLVGFAAIVVGVGMWSVPVALVVGGGIVLALAVLLERGRQPTSPSTAGDGA